MSTMSPYPGLRPFQHEEAHLFFGRETQVEDMLSRLEMHRFLAVVGTSGCGKSSLVRAGLIPALEQGFLSGAHPNWRMAITRPGSAPFGNLTAALLQETALGPERQREGAGALLEATLRRGPLGLEEAVAESNLPGGTNLLVLVDQFEEIFRYRQQTSDMDDADAFVGLLLAAAQSRQPEAPIYVVITMRSDFIGDCAWFTGLPEAINDSQFLTPRLTRDQYRAAIVEPARAAGGQLADALVNQLLNDLRGEPDQLPVLQHVLMRMWTQATENGSTRTLTLDDYEAARKLSGALSQHCDEILYSDLDPDQQRIAEIMFRALCERGSDQRDTRRPVQVGKVAAIAGVEVEAVKPVVDAFRGEGRNFLMPPISTPLEVDTTLDISHESLIRHWHTLNTWVAAEAESARQYQRLEDAAKRRQEGAGAELWRGVDLHNAQRWKEQEKPTEVWAGRYGDAYPLAMSFLEQSDAEEKAQQRQKEEGQRRELERAQELAEAQKARADEQAKATRRFQILASVIGVLLLIALGIAIYAQYQQNIAAKAQQQAERDKRQADVERQRAESEQEKARLAAEEAKRHQQRAEVRLARYFSAVSKANAQSKPVLSVLLGLEAIKASPIPAAEQALRSALANIGGTPLVGHEGRVRGVAFSPDGLRLASASVDSTVRIWKVNDPEAQPIILRGHERAVYDVTFSPDGLRLASASSDNTVRIWKANDPEAHPTILRGHERAVYDVTFSPDGLRLASASSDNTVRIWKVNDPEAQPAILRGHKEAVYGVTFSPDGLRLASASSDNTVRIWKVNDLEAQPAILRGHERAVYSAAFSPDGLRLASASADNTVRIWKVNDLEAQPTILRGHEGRVRGVAFSPDGLRLASASLDNTVRIWKANDPEAQPAILRGHERAVYSAAFSPDGLRLASASSDHTVRIWKVNDPEAQPTILRGHEEAVYGVAFSPDGLRLASASSDNTVRIWKVNDPEAQPTLLKGHEGGVWGGAFSPDGLRLASASADSTVRIWKVNDPEAQPTTLRGHEEVVWGVTFSPDGLRLASASSDNTVRIWKVNDLEGQPTILRGHEDRVWGVTFSPDGLHLASASSDNTVRIWKVNGPEAQPTILRGHEDRVYGVAFSPDGLRLASASSDSTVRIWKVNDPEAQPTILRGHEGGVLEVTISPDGLRLASASSDNTVRIWKVNDPEAQPTILRGHEGGVWGVAFSPDGLRLASASWDKTVRIWNLVVDDLIDIACQVISRNFSHAEWESFLSDEPYRKTCLNRSLSADFIAMIQGQIEKGQLEVNQAVSKIQHALQAGDKTVTNASDEAKTMIVPGVLERGRTQARKGELKNAMGSFHQALKLAPKLEIEPEKEAKRAYATALVKKGESLAAEGEIQAAIKAYADAQEISLDVEISADTWNTLCWFGATGGFAKDVLDACKKAVDFDPDHGNIRDSRGVARALTGDYSGAIEDFKSYLQWAPANDEPPERILQREEWITMLQDNQNPFTPELLQQIRVQ